MDMELQTLIEILIRKGIVTEKEMNEIENEILLKKYKEYDEDLDYHTY